MRLPSLAEVLYQSNDSTQKGATKEYIFGNGASHHALVTFDSQYRAAPYARNDTEGATIENAYSVHMKKRRSIAIAPGFTSPR